MWFSEEQRNALEKYYRDWDGTSEVRKEDIDKLISETGLTRLQVRGWLRNRKNRGSYKGRVIYHPNQVKALEWVFVNHSNYPHSELKRDLADFMGMSFEQVSKWFETRRRRGCPAAILGQKGYGDEKEWQKILRKIRNLDHIRASNYAKKRRTTSPPPSSSLVTRSPGSAIHHHQALLNASVSGFNSVPVTNPQALGVQSFDLSTSYDLHRSIGPTQTTAQSLGFPLGSSFPSLTSTHLSQQQQFLAPAYQASASAPVVSETTTTTTNNNGSPRQERAKKLSEAMAQLSGDMRAPANPLDLLCVASLCEEGESPASPVPASSPSPPLPSATTPSPPPSSSVLSMGPYSSTSTSPLPSSASPPFSSATTSLPPISAYVPSSSQMRPSALYNPLSSTSFLSGALPTPLPPMRNSM